MKRLVFASGACALVYQVAWTRELRLVFGASTAASAAVVAIFVGGLGIGAFFLGRRAEKSAQPLGMYASLEIAIATSAAATTILSGVARAAYVALGGSVTLGPIGATVARLVLAALVLGAPVALMGGTLPAIARAAEAESDDARRTVAALYGANTLGAVVGCFAATFVLLEVFGTRLTLLLACLVNLLVGVVARSLARSAPPVRVETAVAPAAAPARFVVLAAAIVGFAFFLMEIVWYRMLGPLLGGTVFTFGLILGLALLGVGLGGAIYPRVFARRRATLGAFAVTCLAEAALLLVPYALGDRLAVMTALLRPLGSVTFAGAAVTWTIVGAIVVVPAAVMAGVQFPALVALLGQGRAQVARHVGVAYAANTAGAIFGALAGGFGLLPRLGAPGCWRFAAATLLGTGLAALALSRGERLVRLSAALVFAVGLVLLFAPGPSAAWRHTPIGAGRVNAELLGSPNAVEGFLRESRRKIVWEADGVESSVALEASTGLAFVLNGKVDGHARNDAGTQVMSGLLGAMLHGSPRSSMVIGLGTGSTAGWLARVPSMERVDVVELEPAIAHVARACAAVNEDALDDPKVHLAFGDAREWLVVRRAEYDLVFSEPSNPYRAGIASLFTQEYYGAVLSHLSPSGIFLQWVQAYEVDARTVRAIMATLAAVFPFVETWQSKYQDLLFVASRAPIAKDARVLRARVAEEPYARALAAAWGVSDLEGVLAHHLARPSLARAVAGLVPEIATDDANAIEFGFARAVGQKGSFDAGALASVARARNESSPEIRGDVDWARVEYARRIVAAMEPAAPFENPLAPEDRSAALLLARWAEGDDAGALAALAGFEPRGPFELAVAADVAARASHADASRLIDALTSKVMADGLRALLLARQGKPNEAAAALEASFAGYRADPWPYAPVMAHVVAEAPSIAAASPEIAARVFRALEQPFAVRMLDADRLGARLRIAGHAPGVPCRDAIEALEPHFPWELRALELRVACYGKAGDGRAESAARDVLAFRDRASFPFADGL